ncbi:MAG: sensor histidine kinase [Tidjanibacter sp.]|nr:sensor histidine kinase [Tidjanibacter sp.]
MMKIKTINTAAIIVGLITIFCVAIGLVMGRFFSADGWWWGFLFAIGSGIVVFMGDKWVMKNFFIQRIKPLYRIVLGRDIKTTELSAELEQTNHPERSVSAELNRWAEQNQREIARLKENETYRKEFVGNVSHEIKTPIFNIQGYISTLLDGGINDPVIYRRYLERTEKSINRLINITNDLEAISKLESGVLNLNYERFDIVALTRDIVDTIEFEATKKNINIVVGSSFTVPYPPVWVRADRYYVEQVLINLIINSIRYGNEGGETFVKFIDLFDKVLIEVRDNGRGIAKEDIPRVFERFYRTDKGRSREQGGTGLGLSIVKHVLEAHGETINLRSELGKGSTFSFTLSKN